MSREPAAPLIESFLTERVRRLIDPDDQRLGLEPLEHERLHALLDSYRAVNDASSWSRAPGLFLPFVADEHALPSEQALRELGAGTRPAGKVEAAERCCVYLKRLAKLAASHLARLLTPDEFALAYADVLALFAAAESRAIVDAFAATREPGAEADAPVARWHSFATLVALLEARVSDVAHAALVRAGASATLPNMMKHIVLLPQLRACVGGDVLFLLTGFMASNHALNLRNLVWHGFLHATELSPCYVDLALVLLLSFEWHYGALSRHAHERRPRCALASHAAVLAASPWMARARAVLPAELAAVLRRAAAEPCGLIAAGRVPMLAYGWRAYEAGRHAVSLTLALPLLEQGLRGLFSRLNAAFAVAALVAHADVHYVILDDLVAARLPDGSLNALPGALGAGTCACLADLCLDAGGPRLRAKLSHGELAPGQDALLADLTALVWWLVLACARVDAGAAAGPPLVYAAHFACLGQLARAAPACDEAARRLEGACAALPAALPSDGPLASIAERLLIARASLEVAGGGDGGGDSAGRRGEICSAESSIAARRSASDSGDAATDDDHAAWAQSREGAIWLAAMRRLGAACVELCDTLVEGLRVLASEVASDRATVRKQRNFDACCAVVLAVLGAVRLAAVLVRHATTSHDLALRLTPKTVQKLTVLLLRLRRDADERVWLSAAERLPAEATPVLDALAADTPHHQSQ